LAGAKAQPDGLFVIVLVLLLVIDLLRLPFDHERAQEHDYEGSDLSFCISTLPA
jgi:hypothetical protein